MSAFSEVSYWSLCLAVLARQLCLPVPAILFLITAGTLAAEGRLHLSLVLLMGVLGCLAGDGVWFWFGRRWGSKIVRVICRLSSDPRAAALKAHRLFDQWGLRVLVVSKFVPGLDGVTPPLAGAEGAPILSFLAHDALGGLLWSAFYTLLGFLFAHQLQAVGRVAHQFGHFVAIVVGVPLLAYILWRAANLIRMIRHLRLRRMSPLLLSRKLEAHEKIAVLDLLNFEDGDDFPLGIPGSVRVDPAGLRTAQTVIVPDDVSLVLCCSSRREIVSARVALALSRIGVENVWVLDGGLSAWQALNLPLSSEFSTRDEVAERLGIQFPGPHDDLRHRKPLHHKSPSPSR